MRLADKRTALSRGLAWVVTIGLYLGSAVSETLAQDAATAGGPATIASGGEAVLLRESPGWDAAVLATLSDGGALDVAGEPAVAADGSAWLPVVTGGQSGYVPAGYVVSGSAAAPAPLAEPATAAPVEVAPVDVPDPTTAPASGAAATTTEANLRAWPSADAEILQVLPPGTTLSVDGGVENGFVPVSGNGGSGWVAAELLAEGANTVPAVAVDSVAADPVAEPPPLVAPDASTTTAPEPPDPAPAASRESTGIVWPFSGGEWQVVQGYNNGTHSNRGGFAQYKYALDWARSDGETAGQPVFAPVSGSIQWTDRGSGGMLIDAGNGYGVALLHVTFDGNLSRGDEVERGQRIGTISGPGGDGYMSMAHIEIDSWRLTGGGGHESVPFVGPNAIAGQEFPDSGGANQHMGATVTP